VIGGLLPGPYSLLLFLVEPGGLFTEMKREPQAVLEALQGLAEVLAAVGHVYREAGADFITVHDMGGSPAFIGPAKYEQFVFPAEQALMERLPGPRVLSVCGDVTRSLGLLNRVGAEAISIDQTTNAATARAALTDTLLFGNIDPVATLSAGNEAGVHEAVQRAHEAGVDAIWPGCDLVPSTPIQNVTALMKNS
jgi:[methyl-Co(III) methanol-specific corrinoid protein]:coenzyme M methyltransferase